MKLWLVWNCAEKGEAVAFDNESDARQTSTGRFKLDHTSIGAAFFDDYGDNAPLIVEEIEIPVDENIDPRLQRVGKAITELAVAQAIHSRKLYGEEIKVGPVAPLADLKNKIVAAENPSTVEDEGEADIYGAMLRLVIDAARRAGVPYDVVISRGLKQVTSD